MPTASTPRVRCSRAWRLPTWDRKLVPLPGSRVDVEYSAPWQVTPENREAVREAIRRHLDGEGAPEADAGAREGGAARG